MEFDDVTFIEGEYEGQDRLLLVEGTAPGRGTGSRIAKNEYIENETFPQMNGTDWNPESESSEADLVAEKELLDEGENYRIWDVGSFEGDISRDIEVTPETETTDEPDYPNDTTTDENPTAIPNGGEDNMTELSYEDVLQAGSLEYDQSLSEDDRHSEEGVNRDYDENELEIEELGVAVYLEQIATEETISADNVDNWSGDVTIEDWKGYVAEQLVDPDADFDMQKVRDYKIGMADSYEDAKRDMTQFIEIRNELITELEAEGFAYQALLGEAQAERDSAEEAIREITNTAKQSPVESQWLNHVSDLDAAVRREAESAQRKQEIESNLQDLRDKMN